MNFQVRVLKILISYPGGFAGMADLKRDMAILATSSREWADRTRRVAARVPGLDIFSHGLVVREAGGWKITPAGIDALAFIEARPVADERVEVLPVEDTAPMSTKTPIAPMQLPAERAKRRRERRDVAVRPVNELMQRRLDQSRHCLGRPGSSIIYCRSTDCVAGGQTEADRQDKSL